MIAAALAGLGKGMSLLLAALGVSTLAVLFTDTQWADIQSVLNFVVLVYLSYRQQKTRKEIPQETLVALEENGHVDRVAEAVAESVVKRYLPNDPPARLPVPLTPVPPPTPPPPA